MKHERIDPCEELPNRYVLDHLARYYWCRPLVAGKRVLDIACGVGYGTCILAAEASEVVGVDRDADSIEIATRRATEEQNVQFKQCDLYNLREAGLSSFEVIICFETLEHLPDPAEALEVFRDMLTPSGILVVSVPGEDDVLEENPYHLQHFERSGLEGLGRSFFAFVEMWRQDFLACSQFRLDSAMEAKEPNAPVVFQEGEGGSAEWLPLSPISPGTWIMIASQNEVCWRPLLASMGSMPVWHSMAEELRKQYGLCGEFAAKYHATFAELSDLKQKFTAALGWGKYHYNLVTQEEAPVEPEKHLVEVAFQKENLLRAEISNLERKISQLESELARRDGALEELSLLKLRSYSKSLLAEDQVS